MQVFIASKGQYSDWRVVAVCTTKERAEKAQEFFASGNDIEEFELDEIQEVPDGMNVWSICMDDAGRTDDEYYPPRRISNVEESGPDSGKLITGTSWYFTKESRPRKKGEPKIMFRALHANVWARSVEHAIKITNDLRARLLATNQFHSVPLDKDL